MMALRNNKQIKVGALLSYFSIFFNMAAGLIYTPWMITQIGQNNYGLYTLATSLITMFTIDFGMSAATTCFIAKYNAEGNQQAINNLIGLIYKLYLGISAIIFVILTVVYFFLDAIYAQLSPNELETFKILFLVVGTYTVVSFPFTNLNGILSAYEKFASLKLCDLFHKVFIIVAMVVALLCGQGVFALVFVNALSGLLTILIKLIIIKCKTPVKSNFLYSDKSVLSQFFGFSFWTTVSSLAQRLIFNITPTILAAVSLNGAGNVAVFGLATTIEGYIFTFATAINGMFMPRVSKIVHDGKKETEILPLMSKIGRIQCLIIGALVVGFIVFGQSFVIDIWNKPTFSDSYLCAVLLIIPSFFYLPMQIAHTTMIVENKVKIRAYVYIGIGVLNVVLSLFLSKYFGALGASLSIFIAYMVRVILMAIIYKKVLKINMKVFFKKTFFKIAPLLLLCLVVGFLLESFNPLVNKYLRFGANGLVFIAFFVLLAKLIFMNSYEKNLFFGTVKKAFQKITSRRVNR